MRNKFWQSTALMIIDAAIISFSAYLAFLVRFVWFYEKRAGFIPSQELYTQIVVLIVILWIALLRIMNAYDRRFTNIVDELALLFGGLAAGLVLFLGLLYLYKQFSISRQVLTYIASFSFIGMVLSRAFIVFVEKWRHQHGYGIRNVLIIGTGETAAAIANKLKNEPGLGYKLIGIVSDLPHAQAEINGFPVLGRVENVKSIIAELKPEEVILASEKLTSRETLDLVTECEVYGLEFKLVPGLLELMASRVDTDEIGGVPLMLIKQIQWTGFKALLKRLFDIVGAVFFIILLLPIWLIIPVLIRLSSPGLIYFTQMRVGKDGKEFQLFKFRSMYPDAEARLAGLQDKSEVSGHIFKIKEDPRITPIGKWIRKFSIDELPQLFNVLIGTMSMVGPRPPLMREVVKYDSWQKKRLRIAPGITGLWQVSGRSELSFDDMVRLDIYYIENWSLWMDLKILFRTIPAVLSAKGAY